MRHWQNGSQDWTSSAQCAVCDLFTDMLQAHSQVLSVCRICQRVSTLEPGIDVDVVSLIAWLCALSEDRFLSVSLCHLSMCIIYWHHFSYRSRQRIRQKTFSCPILFCACVRCTCIAWLHHSYPLQFQNLFWNFMAGFTGAAVFYIGMLVFVTLLCCNFPSVACSVTDVEFLV